MAVYLVKHALVGPHCIIYIREIMSEINSGSFTQQLTGAEMAQPSTKSRLELKTVNK